MDDHGSQPHPRSSGVRVSTKSKAPCPPELKRLDSPGLSQWYPGNPHLTMDQKENLIDKELSLVVVLPDGAEKMTAIHGSKPLMDLLVTLCAKYHLNPSSYTLELVTSNRHNIKLKPNALIGTLDAEKIILKPKGEDKNKKTGSQMPEATVRMVINYKQTQKTILRVNPRVPLAQLLPAICEKCEFDAETTILLRDVQSLAPLDLSCCLNDYAIRELYARDTKGPTTPACPVSPTHVEKVTPGKDKNQKEKENKGLFSKFRKSKKASEQATTASAPASPVLVSKPRPLSMALPSTNSSPLHSPLSPGHGPKKRRAPPPPVLVSQSCTPDVSPRQRLNSEPVTRLDHDQVSRLSRGSSADSSLRRTKRKAPPPPTSPSAVVQPGEQSQGVPTAEALDEIMEQEESTTASVRSTSDTQRDDNSLSLSLPSPSPDLELPSALSNEVFEDSRSCDLSSDGNQVQRTEDDSSAAAEPGPADARDSPAEGESQLPDSPDPRAESAQSQTSTVSSDLPSSPLPPPPPPPPVTQNEDEVPFEEKPPPPCEQTVGMELTVDTPHPAGEDAQVQTDLVSNPEPVQQQLAASAANPAAAKRDMATLTEELHFSDQTSMTPPTLESPPDSTPPCLATTKPPSIYAPDSEPKPKPSNELTRDYIPKVGMTTYTIVPHKSAEKLRYFEVALTLEAPLVASEEGPDMASLQLEESAAPREQGEVSKEQGRLFSSTAADEVLAISTTTSTTTRGTGTENTAPSSPKTQEKPSPSSPAGSPADVKEIKIPPATKPKPGSFRLAKHKKTPGYYVTSAAEKSASGSPTSGHREDHGGPERVRSPLHSPPAGHVAAPHVELAPKSDGNVPPLIRQTSLPSNQLSYRLSLEKLRSFAAPRPYSPATPSRFAQAVSSAVKKSNSLPQGPKSPQSPGSPASSPVKGPQTLSTKGTFKLKQDSEHTDEVFYENPAPSEPEVEPEPSLPDAAPLGESHL
ncbi:cordon-bleu protein-like 1b [Neosynchiropus ocellatus]